MNLEARYPNGTCVKVPTRQDNGPRYDGRQRDGYGRRIATSYMVQLPGSSRWRRVYACVFGNSGTCYVDGPRNADGTRGEWIVIRGA